VGFAIRELIVTIRQMEFGSAACDHREPLPVRDGQDAASYFEAD
jgi:hypothetical protein